MTPSQRIIVNTTAQYTRTIINVGLSLYSTRLILAALGETDFGIYNVVAGVVAMLSFITNALVTTTQRYLSFYHGKEDKEKIRLVFGNSVLLHVLIGSGALIILLSLAYPVVYSLLNIEPERQMAALYVYGAASVMLFITFLTAPFRSLFIARENIVYISIIDVLDGVLKLFIALFLAHIVSFDKLTIYSYLLVGISVFNLLAFSVYALRHFEECHIPSFKEWDSYFIRSLSSFTGWTIYSTGCIIVRTQGIAIIINRFLGSVINAAYGIALQVSGATYFLAQALTNAMNPQIMKAEGSGNRSYMLTLAERSCKYAYILLSMIAFPLIAEMPSILQFWLGNVPEQAVMFCQFVLLASVIDQLTIGLGTANQAIGNIRNYSIVVNSIKIVTLPCAWACLHYGLPVASVMYCYLGFETLCMLARLPFLKITAQLSIRHFVKTVFVPLVIPTSLLVLTCYAMTHYMDFNYRFILTIFTSAIIYIISIGLLGLSSDERMVFTNIVKQKILHKK